MTHILFGLQAFSGSMCWHVQLHAHAYDALCSLIIVIYMVSGVTIAPTYPSIVKIKWNKNLERRSVAPVPTYYCQLQVPPPPLPQHTPSACRPLLTCRTPQMSWQQHRTLCIGQVSELRIRRQASLFCIVYFITYLPPPP